MEIFLNILHVLVAIFMIGFILVQRGAGAAAGSGFGAGASGTVFGARGAASFLTRTTAVLATAFFVISLVMAMLISGGAETSRGPDLGVMSELDGESAQAAPASTGDVPALPVQATETAPVTDAAGSGEVDSNNASPEAASTAPAVEQGGETPQPEASEASSQPESEDR